MKTLDLSLSPPQQLKPALKHITQKSESLYQLIHQFGNDSGIEQLSPDIQHLFLNDYQPYAKFMANQGQQLIYKITNVSTDVIKLGWAIQSLSQFMKQNLSAFHGSGFHPLLHFRTKAKFEHALGDVNLTISESKTLLSIMTQYHTETNRYTAQINQELDQLAQGPSFVNSEFHQIVNRLNAMENQNGLYFNRLVQQAWHVFNQLSYENNDYFKSFIKQRILHVLDTFKEQATAVSNSVSNIRDCWNLMHDDLGYVLKDLVRLRRDYPKPLKVLTKANLTVLHQKWQDVHDEITRMESSIS